MLEVMRAMVEDSLRWRVCIATIGSERPAMGSAVAPRFRCVAERVVLPVLLLGVWSLICGGTSVRAGECVGGDGAASAADEAGQATVRYLALGDSYTIGEAVAEEQRWPVQLSAALRDAGVACDAPQIIAKTGWTTDELTAGIEASRPRGPFDLVTLLIGVNNQYRGRDVDEYGAQLETLIRASIEFAGGDSRKVILVSIPDYGLTPFIAKSDRDPEQIARELDVFNGRARELAAKFGVGWVDITPVSRQRGAEPEMVASDGLHPSGAMYALWTQAVLPNAKKVLER